MNDIWDLLRCEKRLTESIRQKIIDKFGERGKKAIHAVEEGQVKRYLDFFVVVGTRDEYVVEDDFCTCSDFTFRGKPCWHILAVRIAKATGDYEAYNLWYQDNWAERTL